MMKKIRAELAEAGVSARIGTLLRFFDRRRMTWKKAAQAAEQDRPDILVRRWAPFEGQLDLGPAKLVFIDGSNQCFE